MTEIGSAVGFYFGSKHNRNLFKNKAHLAYFTLEKRRLEKNPEFEL